MTKYCPNCNQEIDKDSKFCDECGADVENVPITDNPQSFTEKNKIPLIIVGATALIVILFLVVSPSALSNGSVFHLEGEPTQSVNVDGVFIKIPQEFRLDPSSIDFSYDRPVMSSSQQWSHETERIALMVMRISVPGVNYKEAAGINGGVQKNMYGYDGYYIEHEEGQYSFVFAKDNKVCVIMTSSPYLFDKIKIE